MTLVDILFSFRGPETSNIYGESKCKDLKQCLLYIERSLFFALGGSTVCDSNDF